MPELIMVQFLFSLHQTSKYKNFIVNELKLYNIFISDIPSLLHSNVSLHQASMSKPTKLRLKFASALKIFIQLLMKGL